MTILRPGTRKRRNPEGRHKCGFCDSLFMLDAVDVAKVKRDSGGDLWSDCPECGKLFRLNGYGDQEPPAP